MSLKAGQRVLDRYVVEAPLGAGGMGEVYRGRHERLGMPVALKILSTDGTPENRKRFQIEA
ncbi:MAG: serine/threonine protein kinase, partial [Acidobacteria bacterium]